MPSVLGGYDRQPHTSNFAPGCGSEMKLNNTKCHLVTWCMTGGCGMESCFFLHTNYNMLFLFLSSSFAGLRSQRAVTQQGKIQ